jgi:type VI secretion system protein ImpK
MHRVHDLTKACFDHVFLLLQPDAIDDVARLHRSAADCVEALETQSRKAGFTAEQARQIKYAMVALLDEIGQAQSGRVSEYWEHHLLQRDYFHEVRAGEGFFTYLETLLDARRDDQAALDILQIYATAIYLGFRGKYAARADAKGFDTLMRRVNDRMRERIVDDETLPPPKSAEWAHPRAPLKLPVWLAGLALLFSAVLMCGYRSEVADDGQRLADRLDGGAQ